MVFSWQTKGYSTILSRVNHCESHEVYDYAIFAFKNVWDYKVNT